MDSQQKREKLNTSMESMTSMETSRLMETVMDSNCQRRYVKIMEKLLVVTVPEGYKFPTSSEEFGTWFCQTAANYFEQLKNIAPYDSHLTRKDVPKYMDQLRVFTNLYNFVNEHLFVLKIAAISTANEGTVYVLDGLVVKSVHLLAQIDEMNSRFTIDRIYFNESERQNVENTKNTLRSFYKKMME